MADNGHTAPVEPVVCIHELLLVALALTWLAVQVLLLVGCCVLVKRYRNLAEMSMQKDYQSFDNVGFDTMSTHRRVHWPDQNIDVLHVEAPNTIATPSSVATGNVSYGIPSDIAQIGEPIEQVVLDTYPKQHNRAFVSDWFKRYKWLQYSVEKDAAFCYPCQQFLPHGSKQTSYTSTGFRNWKNATDSKTGFPKHEKSISHIQAMSMWQEKLQRISTSSSVETLINQKVLEKYRYYVKSIMEVIQFLIVNELALRGNYILEEEKEQGLFQNLFEYTSIRYVKDGVVNESLLMVKTTENLDAATFTELTLNTLTENNIDPLVCLANAMMAFNGDDVAKSIDAALQARSAGLKDAITIIKCVKDEIIKLRSNQMYNQILEEAKSLTSNDCGESENRTQTSKRQVKKPNRMDDYLTYTPCSSARQNIDENDEPFKSEYFETLDILIAELQRRFSDNDDLINSIASLDELDVDKMVPLKNLGLKIPSREEASVVKAYLSRNEDIMENTLQVLYRQREAFKDTYELLRLWRP
ncbi:Zinc finger MYM-type protein 1 [Eumeta japonica]|uniref:Zinc finger MYM-type protein 1 n=1 Tax=Eumeta variegata TaxID=151549 RepID=A0A4C1ZVS5_EUMVA|nr:Zinc finger MYM-type protein 1 [Eumeta japonica]